MLENFVTILENNLGPPKWIIFGIRPIRLFKGSYFNTNPLFLSSLKIFFKLKEGYAPATPLLTLIVL